MTSTSATPTPANSGKAFAKKKLNLIQVFRGLASLLVVLAHGSLIFHQNLNRDFLLDIFGFGGSGVDFFFILSGFIIFYVHSKDIGKPIKLKGFLLKRFIRIYPIYWVVLTGKLLASITASNSDKLPDGWLEVMKAYFLFPQDRVILSEKFLGVSWTLSYEIFFYIIFALLIYLKPKFSVPIFLLWLLTIFGKCIGFIEINQQNYLLSFLVNELNIEFIFGAIAAYTVSQRRIKYGTNFLYIGLFGYLLSSINYHTHFVPWSSVLMFGVPFTLLTIGAVDMEMHYEFNIPYILIFLGDASYSIYLIHGFVINNLTKTAIKLEIVDFLIQNPLLFSLFAILNAVTAVIVGCAMYLYLEKPLMSIMRRRFAKG